MNASTRNHPGVDMAITGLWMAMEGVYSFLDDHETCNETCIDCHEMAGICYVLRGVEATLTSLAYVPDAELRWLREFGFPSPHHLAEILRAQFKELEDELLQASFKLKGRISYIDLQRERSLAEITLQLYNNIREGSKRLSQASSKVCECDS